MSTIAYKAVAGEIEIAVASSSPTLYLDELISLRETIETVNIVSALDAIGWRAPHAPFPRASASLANSSFTQARLSGKE